MAKKICNKCGENNLISAMVCCNCGNSLINSEIVGVGQDKEENICKGCGEILEVGVRNCPYCGFFICKTSENNDFDKASLNSYDKSPSSGNGFLYVISFIIPLVGFIAGAIYLTNDDVDKKDAGTVCIILGIIACIGYALFLHRA